MGWIPGPSGDIVYVGGGKGGTSSAGERTPQVGGGAGGRSSGNPYILTS